MVAFGQLHVLAYCLLDVGYYIAQGSAAGVGGDDYLALHVLAVDGVGSGARYDVGNVAQRHLTAVLRVDDEVAYLVVVGGFHHEVEGSAGFVHLRDGLSGEVHGEELVELGQRDAVAHEQFAARHNLQFGALYLLLHVEVGDALNVLAGVLYLIADGEHAVEVGAEELDGYAGLCAREHGVDAVGDGLAYLYVGSGENGEALAHVVEHFFVTAVLKLERGFYLAHVHTEGVFVELSTTGLACHGLYLGHLQQQSLGTCADGVAFFERDAG